MDKLVSTRLLAQRMQALAEKNADDARWLGEDNPIIRRAEWMLAEFEDAIREAGREYVGTTEASALTGWHPHTLRKRAQQAIDGAPMPEGWEGLLVRRVGTDWEFCVSSVPANPSSAAAA